jgi:transposase
MAITDGNGLPIAARIESASPHEITLVKETIESLFVSDNPEMIIGDMAYDSDPLDEELAAVGIELVAPHKSNRVKKQTQDGRILRRYKRRWKVERFFAWLQNFRRLVNRWEYKAENFLGMLRLGCIKILLRYL